MAAVPTLIVDRETGEPVYAQVARQIRARIASGELQPGTLLPPVRALASDLGVNLNTVARAYWMLEEEGFLRIQSRAGAEVAPRSSERRNGDAIERLRAELSSVFARLWQAGAPEGEVRAQIEREFATLWNRRS